MKIYFFLEACGGSNEGGVLGRSDRAHEQRGLTRRSRRRRRVLRAEGRSRPPHALHGGRARPTSGTRTRTRS